MRDNCEDLTLSAGTYWNCIFGCAGGVLLLSQAQKALLLLPHTAKGASTSSEELNAQISPRTDDEHTPPSHEAACSSTSVLELTATAMMEP